MRKELSWTIPLLTGPAVSPTTRFLTSHQQTRPSLGRQKSAFVRPASSERLDLLVRVNEALYARMRSETGLFIQKV